MLQRWYIPTSVLSWMAFTGHRLRGGDLVRAGLATHFCPSDKLNDLQAALLALPHKTKPEHVRALLDAFHKHDLEFSLAPHLKDIKECFTAPTLDAILDKLGKVRAEYGDCKPFLLYALLYSGYLSP